eukprot:TRINITY_DN923_c0_g1_i15.p1 TRINITY_DN923_c0_g1~~TRINITY_DN923_c0_g1_i15.p1  ORF type:complete len:361 (-),score=13.47 TRINITY_DN923_c0_g1_i15:78-1160(-)
MLDVQGICCFDLDKPEAEAVERLENWLSRNRAVVKLPQYASSKRILNWEPHWQVWDFHSAQPQPTVWPFPAEVGEMILAFVLGSGDFFGRAYFTICRLVSSQMNHHGSGLFAKFYCSRLAVQINVGSYYCKYEFLAAEGLTLKHLFEELSEKANVDPVVYNHETCANGNTFNELVDLNWRLFTRDYDEGHCIDLEKMETGHLKLKLKNQAVVAAKPKCLLDHLCTASLGSLAGSNPFCVGCIQVNPAQVHAERLNMSIIALPSTIMTAWYDYAREMNIMELFEANSRDMDSISAALKVLLNAMRFTAHAVKAAPKGLCQRHEAVVNGLPNWIIDTFIINRLQPGEITKETHSWLVYSFVF